MVNTLELVFRNTAGQEVVMSLADPKAGLSRADAETVMQAIIAENVFTSKGGDLLEIVDARIRSRSTQSL